MSVRKFKNFTIFLVSKRDSPDILYVYPTVSVLLEKIKIAPGHKKI